MIIYEREIQRLVIPTGEGNESTYKPCSQAIAEAYQSGWTGGYEQGLEDCPECSGSSCNLQNGIYELTSSFTGDSGVIFPEEGYDGFSSYRIEDAGYGDKKYQEGYTQGQADCPSCDCSEEVAAAYESGMTGGVSLKKVELTISHMYNIVGLYTPELLGVSINGDVARFHSADFSDADNSPSISKIIGYTQDNVLTTFEFTIRIPYVNNLVSTWDAECHINGLPATILNQTKEIVGEYTAKYTLTFNNIPILDDTYEEGFVYGVTSEQKPVEFRAIRYGGRSIFAWRVHQLEAEINGVPSVAISSTSNYVSFNPYEGIKSYTQDSAVTAFSFTLTMSNCDGTTDNYPDTFDALTINGFSTTIVSQTRDVIYSDGGGCWKKYKYNFVIDSTPIYDRASYEAGLAACQGNQ